MRDFFLIVVMFIAACGILSTLRSMYVALRCHMADRKLDAKRRAADEHRRAARRRMKRWNPNSH